MNTHAIDRPDDSRSSFIKTITPGDSRDSYVNPFPRKLQVCPPTRPLADPIPVRFGQ
jgi:hypothetical protein